MNNILSSTDVELQQLTVGLSNNDYFCCEDFQGF